MNTIKIREDLQSNMSISEVCKKYNLTFNKLCALMQQPIQLPKEKCPEHIRRHYSRYMVYREVEGRIIKYGSFLTLQEAKEVKQRLIDSNWELPPSEYLGMMYIIKYQKHYVIQKYLDGKHRKLVSFKHKEDAMKVRDCLVKFDWDLDYLQLILKQTGATDYVVYKRSGEVNLNKSDVK